MASKKILRKLSRVEKQRTNKVLPSFRASWADLLACIIKTITVSQSDRALLNSYIPSPRVPKCTVHCLPLSRLFKNKWLACAQGWITGKKLHWNKWLSRSQWDGEWYLLNKFVVIFREIDALAHNLWLRIWASLTSHNKIFEFQVLESLTPNPTKRVD